MDTLRINVSETPPKMVLLACKRNPQDQQRTNLTQEESSRSSKELLTFTGASQFMGFNEQTNPLLFTSRPQYCMKCLVGRGTPLWHVSDVVSLRNGEAVLLFCPTPGSGSKQENPPSNSTCRKGMKYTNKPQTN